jgi:lysophospholipase L1-like esterase
MPHLIFALTLALVVPWLPESGQSDYRPWWTQRHRSYVSGAAAEHPQIIFVGDSITEFWLLTGKARWDIDYAPRHAYDLGIRSDTTQNVLWRIGNGELDGVAPRAVVLMIGTNDLRYDWSAGEIARGVEACASAIRAKLPESELVVLGILPLREPRNRVRTKAAAVNAILAHANFGPRARYLDIGAGFVTPDGVVRPQLYLPDHIHLTAQGYEVWSKALDPVLGLLLR